MVETVDDDDEAKELEQAATQNATDAFKAAVSDPDTMHWDEAMNNEDEREIWRKAALDEIRALEEKGTWTEVPIEDAQEKIVPGMWVFRCKRTPNGEIKKYKGRYVVRGDLQEGELDTFAPVCQWSTVRMILVISLMLGWETCSIDFSNAFVQATLDKPVWIHLPRGFRPARPGKWCLRLNKSLYGLSIAPRYWALHLKRALLKLGLKQSEHDPCLFYKDGLIIATYVDDCVCAFSDRKILDKLVSDLREMGFGLTVEGTLAEFLGIKLVRNSDGSFELTQCGLIDKVLKAANMTDCNERWVPADKKTLGMDTDGPVHNTPWGYSSIVGMLMYLATNTRAELMFSVSQVCRFNHNPKASHTTAVKTILRYLKHTRNQGMILRPNGKLNMDLYCDGDFAGLYKSDPDSEPSSAKSRMCYIITLSGCPLVWKSSLLQEVALSVCEVEYSALSHSLRGLIPLRRLLKEMVEHVQSVLSGSHFLNICPVVIRSRVFEDNSAALQLAKQQRLTNRTRYFHTKWHWFWEYVNNHTAEFELLKVDTRDNLSDIGTKGCVRDVFERLHKGLLGW